MTLKRLFIVTAGIAAGVVVGLGLLVGAYQWWDSRPKPRDSTSITATYDGPYSNKDGGTRKVGLRYALENKTDNDILAYGSSLRVYIRRDDGSLIDLKAHWKLLPADIHIPPRERVLWL